MAQMQDVNGINSQINHNNDNGMQSNNSDTDSIHSESLIPSEYQKAILSDNNNNNNQYINNNLNILCKDELISFSTAFKCPENHSLHTYPVGFGKCFDCDRSLISIPCRHCNICNYNVCLECYGAPKNNCIGNHGLIIYFPEIKHDFWCDVCGEEVAENDAMHSCRICDYDVCSKCYIPRNVLNNIDLNNIPLEPYKYDKIFANNYNIHDMDDVNINNQDKEIINDLDFIKFDFEYKEVDISFNVEHEEDVIDKIIYNVDTIRDEIIDLEQEIRCKQIIIDKLRRIELIKRTQLKSVKNWIKENKLIWESFKLQWKQWNIECFIEFLKRIELECCTFNQYYNGNNIDRNCKIKIEKYMNDNIDKFGSNIFYGRDHLKLFNELSLYRIGIINDKDCNIIYGEIQKLIKFDKKNNKKKKKKFKKSSKKKKGNKGNKGYKKKQKKRSHRKQHHLDLEDKENNKNILDLYELSSYDESDDDKDNDDDDDDYDDDNNNELLMFLKRINLDIYYDKLINDGFDDMNALNELDKNDLIQLGMKNGHSKKLLKYIQIFNDQQEINKNQIEGHHYYISPK